MKCTQQPEHIAEAVYLHQRKNLKNIQAVHYISEATARAQDRNKPGRYEEYRIFAIVYSSDEAFDTSFTIYYPTQTATPNLPFTIVAGNKDTLREQGLDAHDIQRILRRIPDLLAVQPIYRPDLNLKRHPDDALVSNPQNTRRRPEHALLTNPNDTAPPRPRPGQQSPRHSATERSPDPYQSPKMSLLYKLAP